MSGNTNVPDFSELINDTKGKIYCSGKSPAWPVE